MSTQDFASLELIKTKLKKDIPVYSLFNKSLAAVHILLLENTNTDIVFTKRSTFVENHKNEISFPGGAMERKDHDLYQTALRETCEEINICKQSVHFLGALDSFKTHYDLTIYPFISSISELEFMQAVPNWEVEEIFTIPIHWFMDKERLEIREIPIAQNSQRQVYFYKEYKGHTVWGITAAILKEFIDQIKK